MMWKRQPYSEESLHGRYLIRMKSPNFLQHSVRVNEIDGLESNSSISFDKGQVITNLGVRKAPAT